MVGALFLIRVARIFSGVHFSHFLVVVTFKPTLNVQTSKQRGKNLAVDGGPCHGTTVTMLNPARCEVGMVRKMPYLRY